MPGIVKDMDKKPPLLLCKEWRGAFTFFCLRQYTVFWVGHKGDEDSCLNSIARRFTMLIRFLSNSGTRTSQLWLCAKREVCFFKLINHYFYWWSVHIPGEKERCPRWKKEVLSCCGLTPSVFQRILTAIWTPAKPPQAPICLHFGKRSKLLSNSLTPSAWCCLRRSEFQTARKRF